MQTRLSSSRSILLPLGILCLSLAGCTTSPGRSAYTTHRSHQIQSGPAENKDVELAFGLGQDTKNSNRMAVVDE